MGCHAEKFLKARDLVSELMVSRSKKEDKEGEDYTYGLGSRLHNSGPNGVLGRIEVSGLANLKNPLDQEMETQIFQVGPKISSAAELGKNKKAKSPTRGKTHAHASKTGKENVRVGTSKVLKKKTMMEITRMDVEEVNTGAKRKTRAPLEEIMENAKVRKRPKLEAKVIAFGKLLATQMGSAMAAV